MLDKVRTALRISGNALDSEIQDVIDTCYADMHRVGIVILDKEDPLIVQCVKLYARWQFNFENQAERYEKAYVSTRDGISLCGDYNV